MKIWVDADACPKVIREIVIRAAERTGLETAFVTNQALRLNVAPHIKLMQVPDGPDVADSRIVELCEPGDLVITADIPLQLEWWRRAQPPSTPPDGSTPPKTSNRF